MIGEGLNHLWQPTVFAGVAWLLMIALRHNGAHVPADRSCRHHVVKFTIQRDGRIVDVVLEKPSGFQSLDELSQQALLTTKTLNSLPSAFPSPTLTVHLNFQYQR